MEHVMKRILLVNVNLDLYITTAHSKNAKTTAHKTVFAQTESVIVIQTSQVKTALSTLAKTDVQVMENA